MKADQENYISGLSMIFRSYCPEHCWLYFLPDLLNVKFGCIKVQYGQKGDGFNQWKVFEY